MKNKGIIIAISVVVIICAVVAGCLIFKNKTSLKPEDTLSSFVGLIKEQKYEEMYNMISQDAKSKISQEDFIKRNKNIYEGISAENIEIQNVNVVKEKGTYKVSYKESMSTAAGKIEFENTAKFVKEDNELKLNWSSSIIFPELRDTDKVRISSINAKRGEILDRIGYKLAENGTISTVGIVPGKLGDTKTENIKKISELTGVSVEYINTQISASYVKDDTFVPIKNVSNTNTDLKDKLLQIPGIMINSKKARVYPLGEEAAHLIGYVQTINADELKANEDKGYSSNSLIGKSGLEQAYEDKLRGIDGTEIYITDETGNKLKTLASQDKKDGTDVKLTIDSSMQKQLYDQMKNDRGFFVVMHPSTGELLAMVSTPSYDSNDFVLGMTNDKWNELNQNANKPLYNRFLQSYSPGSTFKPVTAAIGLNSGKISAETAFNYSGLKWQKDSSWKTDFITTLTAYSGTKNITNALIHSDNIFFAQAAIQIGSKTFGEELEKIGFNKDVDKEINFPLSFKKSQYSNSEKGITTEKKLADSGYGQGDVLVNPIHMASIYSAFANNGNMVKPYIEYKENSGTTGTVGSVEGVEYYKENAISSENANKIKNDLIQVVENPEGTATDMRVTGTTIAGKTGTAELKNSMTDSESGTLGWFDCFTTSKGAGKDILVISMVENTQNNRDGGSHYLIKKIKEGLRDVL